MQNVAIASDNFKPRPPRFLDGLFVDWVEDAAEEMARLIMAGGSLHAVLERLARLAAPTPRGWR